MSELDQWKKQEPIPPDPNNTSSADSVQQSDSSTPSYEQPNFSNEPNETDSFRQQLHQQIYFDEQSTQQENNNQPNGQQNFDFHHSAYQQQPTNSEPFVYQQSSDIPNGAGSEQTNHSSNMILMPRKKTPIWLFGVLGSTAIVAIVLIICFTVPSISNSIALMTSTPQKYYQKVETASTKKAVDAICKFYENVQSSLQATGTKKNQTSAFTVDMNITIDPDFANSIDSTELTTLNNMFLHNTSYLTNEKLKSIIELKHGEDIFATFTSFMSAENQDTYFQLKELSENYLHASSNVTEDMLKNNFLYSTGFYSNQTNVLNNLKDFPLTEDILNTLLHRYDKIIVSELDQVTWEKNVSLTSNGVTSKCTKLMVSITGEDLYRILINILKEAEKDNELKSIIQSLSPELKELTDSEYTAGVNLLTVGLESYKPVITSIDPTNMIVWVDQNGSIVGRELIIAQPSIDEDTTIELGYTLSHKSSDTGLEAWFDITGYDGGSIRLTGLSQKGKDTSSGNFEFIVKENDSDPFSIGLTYENFKIINKERGYIQGNFTGSTILAPDYQFILDCSAEKDSQDFTVEILEKNKKTGSISFALKEIPFEDFELPNATTSNIYESPDELNTYFEQANIDSYAQLLKDILPFEDADIDEFFSNISNNGWNTPPLNIENILPTEDPNSEEPNTTQEPEATDDSTSTEDPSTTDSPSNKASATPSNLPAGVTADENGVYGYELSEEDVKKQTTPSTGYTHYSLKIDEVLPAIEELVKEYLPNATQETPSVYNYISGSIAEDYPYEHTFLSTTNSWVDLEDDSNNAFRIMYDNIDQSIIGIEFSVVDPEVTKDIVLKSLSILEGEIPKEKLKELKKSLEPGEESYILTTYNNSTIYISYYDSYAYATIMSSN